MSASDGLIQERADTSNSQGASIEYLAAHLAPALASFATLLEARGSLPSQNYLSRILDASYLVPYANPQANVRGSLIVVFAPEPEMEIDYRILGPSYGRIPAGSYHGALKPSDESLFSIPSFFGSDDTSNDAT